MLGVVLQEGALATGGRMSGESLDVKRPVKGALRTVCVTGVKLDLDLKDCPCGTTGCLNPIPMTGLHSLAESAITPDVRKVSKARGRDASRCKMGSIYCPHVQK